MYVELLELEGFRNLERVAARFSPGLNLIVGRNAQGKTNMLEALYCLSGMGSPRGPDAALVKDGAERALLHASITRSSRRLTVDMEIRPGRGTRALINKTPAPSLAALGEVLVCVFFGPDELSLVKGSPEGRRRFLDELTVKLRPARDSLRREWDRVLKQRNALLKSAPRAGGGSIESTLGVWDEAFCRAGAALAAARLSVLGRLLPFVTKRFEAIGGGGRIELTYESSWLDDDLGDSVLQDPGSVEEAALRAKLAEALERVRPRELERRLSLVGPQRDDVAIKLASSGAPGTLDARSYGSQGEQRTGALALKLAEYDLLADSWNEEPLLLLDDVFSELDPQRRAWLADAVRATAQTVLTSAEPGAQEAAGAETVLEVAGGELRVR